MTMQNQYTQKEANEYHRRIAEQMQAAIMKYCTAVQLATADYDTAVRNAPYAVYPSNIYATAAADLEEALETAAREYHDDHYKNPGEKI